MTRLRIIFLLVILGLSLFASAHAYPPHPSKHYRWEGFPNGNVILYFMKDGQHVKYIYAVNTVRAATECTHSYGKDTFKLITFDSSYPYWYTMSVNPIMRWDADTKRFIKLVGK